MKKLFLIFVFALFVLTNVCLADTYYQTLNENISIIRGAIRSYKAKNYTQCISTLSEYVKTHPVSAAAYYYLGNSYMKLGLTEQAKENYSRTIDINTVPQLTSYSIQAIDCIDNFVGIPCVYYSFNKKQIVELQSNPSLFLTTYRNSLNTVVVREGVDEEIERLMRGEGPYSSGIHPDVKRVLSEERNNRERYNMNQRSMLPVSDQIAKVIKAPYPVHSYAPDAESASTDITADEMELIIMSETAALKK